MTDYSDLKLAVEMISGGKNTVLLDKFGLPSVMVVIPKMTEKDVGIGSDETVLPAFKIEEKEKKYFCIGKYINTVINGSPCSLPLPFYASGFSFETALKANFDKGAGWCLATNAMYAAIALLCKASGFMPRGNNSFGKDYSKPFEKSIPVLGYDHDRIAKTLCGSGPVSWNHNNDATGICDLNGNAAEWAAGLRLVDGEINIIPDNNAALPTVDQGAESTLWKAIRADGTLVEPGTEGAIKLDLVSNHITFTTGEQTSPTVNNHYTAFSALGAGTGLTETIPQLLYSLALFPKAPGDIYTGSIYATWPGEMLALRGGVYFFNSSAGVFCIMLSYPRTRRDGNFQNRSGYVGEL